MHPLRLDTALPHDQRISTTASRDYTMASLSTHVLDTAAGKPAANVQIDLYRLGEERAGVYELVFQAGTYFANANHGQSEPPFLDEVVIRCGLGADGHYHVPLLVTPWSYSTYRGS